MGPRPDGQPAKPGRALIRHLSHARASGLCCLRANRSELLANESGAGWFYFVLIAADM